MNISGALEDKNSMKVSCLWRRDDGEGVHDSVRILLPDLGDEEGAHSGSGAAAERVSQLQ